MSQSQELEILREFSFTEILVMNVARLGRLPGTWVTASWKQQQREQPFPRPETRLWSL